MGVLVAGGECYIEKVLINHLLKKYNVTYLDNLIYGQQQSIKEGKFSDVDKDILNY